MIFIILNKTKKAHKTAKQNRRELQKQPAKLKRQKSHRGQSPWSTKTDQMDSPRDSKMGGQRPPYAYI